jgi:hypothetical protein
VNPKAPHTKPLFHSLLPELGQPMYTDTASDQRDNNRTHPSREQGEESWVIVQLLHNDVGAHAKTGSLLDADVDDVGEADPDLATSEYGESSNTDPFVDLCIELGSWDMIDIDEDTNIFLIIDSTDSYANRNS